MELFAILFAAYIIWIGTRTPDQQQNHLFVLWGLMAIGVVIALMQWTVVH